MKEGFVALARLIKDAFQPRGLNIVGLHYFIAQPGQRKNKGIFVCFDGFTHNPHFFGKDSYENRRRIKMLDTIFEIGFERLKKMFPTFELTLDAYVKLRKPHIFTSPIFENLELKSGMVDVFTDREMRFVDLDYLLKTGEVEEGSTFFRDCREYGIAHILKQGRHHISPDNSSVKALEAILDGGGVESILEMGSGVGICGIAAQKRGIADFTFVDSNQTVCEYLKEKSGYPVICADAFAFEFNRHYDVVLMGLPYELNPWFLETRGNILAKHCDVVLFQSGTPAFFEFEHDWIFGQKHFSTWSWWNKKQTIKAHFPYWTELRLEWQLIIVAAKSRRRFAAVTENLKKRNFVVGDNYQRIFL